MYIKYFQAFVFIIVISCNYIAKAQINSIVTGNINENYIYHDYTPDEELHTININLAEYFFVDVNNDSIVDFRFSTCTAGGQGVTFSSVDIVPLNYSKISSHFLNIGGGCGFSDIAVGKKYFEGDTITYDSSFIDSTTVNFNIVHFFEGCYDYNFNEWNDTGNMYIAYCLDEGVTKTLGWFKVRDVTYSSIIIDSYFYNSYGVHTNNIIQNININVSPNPSDGFLYLTGSEIEEIEIINSCGQLLDIKKVYSDNTQLNMKDYGKGFFILKIKTRLGIVNKRVILK